MLCKNSGEQIGLLYDGFEKGETSSRLTKRGIRTR